MNRFLFLSGILAIFVTGCAKAPQTIESPVIKAVFEKNNAAEPFLLRVEGRVYNETQSTVFAKYTADLVLQDKSGKDLLTLTVEKDRIYPFARTAVAAEKRFTKDTFAPVAATFAMDSAELEKNGFLQPIEIDEKNFKLKNIKAQRRDIIDVLKEGKK
jgi:hypothetical protein